MLPKPWIIDTDKTDAPSRPRPRVSDDGLRDGDRWEELPEEATNAERGVEILQISPANPHEIAI